MSKKKKQKSSAPEISEASAPRAGGATPVAFIEDPFNFRNLGVEEAQQSGEAIDEGLDFVESADRAALPSADDTDSDTDTDSDSDSDRESGTMTGSGQDANSADENESAKALSAEPVESADETDEKFQRLASAVAEQVASDAAEALAGTGRAEEIDEETRAALELAAQIAEDQALQAQEAQAAKEAEALDPELKAALPQLDANGQLDLNEVQSCLEAILFISDKPVSLKRLHELLGPDFSHGVFQEAITCLKDRYQTSTHHGIELVEVAGGYQFRTRPGRAALARKLSRVQTQRLSSGAMESLAIIAYKQPAMKDDIDKVRGVDSSYFIRGLLDRKLIRISGRSEMPGRPMLYSTTDEFLELFGLRDLHALPPLSELESMVPTSEASQEEEDPRVKEMRKLVNQMTADTSTTLTYDPREDEKILKEMKDRIGSIPVSTPYLDEQKAAEKLGHAAQTSEIQPSLEPARAESPALSVADEMAAQMVSESLDDGGLTREDASPA